MQRHTRDAVVLVCPLDWLLRCVLPTRGVAHERGDDTIRRGRNRRDPAATGAVDVGVARTRRGCSCRRGARTRQWHRSKAPVRRRCRRSRGTATLPDRSRAVPGGASASTSPARQRRGIGRLCHAARRARHAADRKERRQPTGLRQRDRAAENRAREHRSSACTGHDRRARRRLHACLLADLGQDRPQRCHRGCVCPAEPGDAAHDGDAARSDLCRHVVVGG